MRQVQTVGARVLQWEKQAFSREPPLQILLLLTCATYVLPAATTPNNENAQQADEPNSNKYPCVLALVACGILAIIVLLVALD